MEDTAQRGAPCVVLFAKYNEKDQVEEDELGEACGANGGEEERV
jgi:hypothetical protein